MQFQLSEELEMTRSVIRSFAEQQLAPNAVIRDEEACCDRKLFDSMGELGLAGIPIPEQYGGAGSDFMTYTIVLEELSKICASSAAMLAAHTAYTAWPIYLWGSEELREELLIPLATGKKLGGWGAPELEAAESPNRSMRAGKESDSAIVLSGQLPFVVNAGAADAYVMFAYADHGARKLNAYVVESGASGSIIGMNEQKLGLCSFMTARMTMSNCKIPSRNRLGRQGEGQRIVRSIIDGAYISSAALALGIAQGALESAAAYAKEREQFGRFIGRQQGISFKLADMSARTEAARLLVYQAAWRKDEGLPCGQEAAIARKYASNAAIAVTIEAVQIFGGYGYMREYKMERYLRDAKCLESAIGVCGLQTNLIARILAE